MKKTILAFLVTIIVISCNQSTPPAEQKSDSTASESKKADDVKYAYKATYSSDFEIGKAENAKVILDIWKAFEDNKLGDTKSLWADSVTMQFENYTFHGKADSAIKEGKAERARYTSVVDSVDAVVSLHSKDRNEDWVSVWAREYTVNTKGKKDTADIHEIWQLKNGKASYMSQYRAHRKW